MILGFRATSIYTERLRSLLKFSFIQNWYDAFLNYLYISIHMSTYVFTSQECVGIGGGERYLS